jgi:hypothetical protein
MPIEVLLRFTTPADARGKHSHSRGKNLCQTCPSQSVQVLHNFVQLVLVLHQICSTAQLFSPRCYATVEPKPKYENIYTIVYPESLPVAGSKGVPCQPVPQRETALISIFSLRATTNSNR